jgi:molybdenum cofactor guanylyltransferase
MKNCSIFILCGGKSSRMGQEKGLVIWDNFFPKSGKIFEREMIASIIDATVDFGQISLLTNSEKYDSFPLPKLRDIYPNLGPLGGIYTALCNSKTEWNLILSCDIPLINKKLLIKLKNELSAGFDIVYAQTKDKKHPLIAFYNRSLIGLIEQKLKNNSLKLMDLLAEIPSKSVLLEENEAYLCQNFNAMSDFEQFIMQKNR